jgi:hypothetical protein
MMVNKREPKSLGKNLLKCNFGHQKSQLNSPENLGLRSENRTSGHLEFWSVLV